MKKIASFTIDHIKLQPGIYVSRKDYLGDQVITTFGYESRYGKISC